MDRSVTQPVNLPEQHWTYPPAYLPQDGQANLPTPNASPNKRAQLAGGYYGRQDWAAPPQAQKPAAPIWKDNRQGVSAGTVLAFILAGLGILVVLFFALLEAGISETLVGAIVALIPLTVVLATVRWLERWEPEPRLYLFLAFAWGAGVATATAMFINTAAFSWLMNVTGDPATTEILGVSIIAPITEEILKGAGLLGLVLWRKRLVDSGVNLLVYAAMIACGFAFTENILYFARGSSMGMLGLVFIGRAIMSPFAHVMFTSCLALILALVLNAKRIHLLWAYPVGTVLAATLHGVWNLTAVIAGEQFLTVFMWLHAPIFLLFIIIVVAVRRRERRNIVNQLETYARAGWFSSTEVAMLGSMHQRSIASQWSSTFGVRAAQAMARFQRNATSLASNRHRARTKEQDEFRAREQQLLTEISHNRQEFFTAAGPTALAKSVS